MVVLLDPCPKFRDHHGVSKRRPAITHMPEQNGDLDWTATEAYKNVVLESFAVATGLG